MPLLSHAQESGCAAPDPDPALYAQMRSEVPAILQFAQNRNRSSVVEIPVYYTVVRNADGEMPPSSNGVDASEIDAALNFLNTGFDGSGLHFYRLGNVNFIDDDQFYQYATEFIHDQYSYVKTAMNVYVIQIGATGNASNPGQNQYGSPAQDNTTRLGPTAPWDTYTHETGHNFGLLHTYGLTGDPTTNGTLYYRYPDVLTNPNQVDHPYSTNPNARKRELVIRDITPGKNFPTPNCYESGDFCCDTEADASGFGYYKQTFPAFDPVNIANCLQGTTNCIGGWGASNCAYTGEYRDYNEDLITGCLYNFMASGYHDLCTPLEFTPEQKDRIAWTYDQLWKGWLEDLPINVNDRVEYRGSADPMQNIVIRWRHNSPADRYTNSISNASGDFQGVLYNQTLRAEVRKIGSSKEVAGIIDPPGLGFLQWYADAYTYGDWLQDVSTYDLLRIRRHILGIEPLDDGYRMIAADANHSNSITTYDLVELSKLILGIYTKLPQFNAPWRFVPEYIPQDYPTQFNLNPFAMNINGQDVSGTPYTEPTWEYVITNGTNGKSGYDGIKIGDVDPDDQIVCDNPPSLQMPHTLLSQGETYEITVKPTGFANVAAFQLGLFVDHEQLEVLNVGASDLPEFAAEDNVGLTNLEHDELAVLWLQSNAAPHTLSQNNTLFKLTVEAKEPVTNLGAAINLHHPHLKSVFYDSDGCQEAVLMQVTVEQISGERSNNTSGKISTRNTTLICHPNPLSEQLNIYFESEAATTGTLLFADMHGKTLQAIPVDIAKGLNTVTLSDNDLENLPTGILTVTLRTQDGVRSTKLVKL